MTVVFALLSVAVVVAAEKPSTAIKVDQVGYLPSAPKIAIVAASAQDFIVKRVGDNKSVFRGTLSVPTKNSDTGDTVLTADFSVEAAADNLHHLLGRNTLLLSFVTQVGANPVQHPHHRPSGADKNAEPWPGLLSGGPNARRQDATLQRLPDIYADDQESYASNEIAINWQAMLVLLLAGQLR